MYADLAQYLELKNTLEKWQGKKSVETMVDVGQAFFLAVQARLSS